MNKGISIVVSRFDEDIIWTEPLKNKASVLIYNKGINNVDSFKNIENIGRESHTYLRYILDHYENLPEHNIFVQGDAPEHGVLGDIIKVLERQPGEFYPFRGSGAYSFEVIGTGVPDFIKNQFSVFEKTPTYLYRTILERDDSLIKDIKNSVAAFACFYVNKNNILRHKKRIYENLFNEHYKSIHSGPPGSTVEYAGTMEYSWHLIFDSVYYN